MNTLHKHLIRQCIFATLLTFCSQNLFADVYKAADLSSSPEVKARTSKAKMPNVQLKQRLNYKKQPPLITHDILNYQLHKDSNHCLQCHDENLYRSTNSPPMSQSHYLDRKGKPQEVLSGTHYFCLQCHVPQSNAVEIIENEFKRADGFTGE